MRCVVRDGGEVQITPEMRARQLCEKELLKGYYNGIRRKVGLPQMLDMNADGMREVLLKLYELEVKPC